MQASPEPAADAEPTPEQAKKAERRRRLLASNLTELAVEFGTDKWGVHRYTPHYERHLQHLRRETFTLLELGIGGYKKRRRSGASMKMWRWFFPKATIVGPRHRGQVVARPRATSTPTSATRPTPGSCTASSRSRACRWS